MLSKTIILAIVKTHNSKRFAIVPIYAANSADITP